MVSAEYSLYIITMEHTCVEPGNVSYKVNFRILISST